MDENKFPSWLRSFVFLLLVFCEGFDRFRSRIFKNRQGILFVEDTGENGCKVSPWLLFFFFHCGLRWKILRI